MIANIQSEALRVIEDTKLSS
ncbi:hypothetical protein AAFM79_19825 [Trichormus azollae HNT15244]